MKRLRLDLEKLRIIADVVQRRERSKRDQADVVQRVLERFFFPHEGHLRLAFEHITLYVDHLYLIADPHSRGA